MSNTITEYHTNSGIELEMETSMGVFYVYYTTVTVIDDEVVFYDENENQVFYACDEDFVKNFNGRTIVE